MNFTLPYITLGDSFYDDLKELCGSHMMLGSRDVHESTVSGFLAGSGVERRLKC